MVERPLNATAASLLGFLHEGPMTGWDLLQRAQERIGSFWTLTQSQVYRELTAMAGAGLVTFHSGRLSGTPCSSGCTPSPASSRSASGWPPCAASGCSTPSVRRSS